MKKRTRNVEAVVAEFLRALDAEIDRIAADKARILLALVAARLKGGR